MFDIIINPKGGKGKSLKALEQVEKILREHGAEYTVHNTEYAGHATELARELPQNPTRNSSLWAATALSTRCSTA